MLRLGLAGFAAVGLWIAGVAGAKEVPFYTVTSPDHPRAWYVGNNFDKLDQALQWNEREGGLTLQITYTLNGNWPVYDDPDLYSSFTVHFPAVHLDPASRELYIAPSARRRITIGSLQPGFLGHRVVLDHNVTVSAHRRKGVIDAALVVSPPDRG